MVTLLLLLALFVIVYKYLTVNNDYWRKKRVPYQEPYPFFGNLLQVFMKKETYQTALHRLYQDGQGHRVFGMFNLMTPTLLIRDIQIINDVLKSDFSRFSSRGLVADHKRDPLSVNVFFMDGHLWKRSRELLRPGFKSGRLRALVALIEQSVKLVFNKSADAKCLEVKALSRRFSGAVIVGPVLGIQLSEAIVDLFVQHCDLAFNVQGWRAVPVFMRIFLPRLALALGIKCVPQVTEDFFKDVADRIKAGREDGLAREDYIQTIISSINGLSAHYSDTGLLDAAMCGQLFIFALGGFETTSSTITYSLYELARHQQVCETARQEILRVMDGHKAGFTYDHLKEMKYLENIINEVLRLHPPICGFYRVCTSAYRIPGTDILLEPGDSVEISVFSIHHDEQYFDDPEEFLPSRFDKTIVEGTFLPFASGPRNCLGMRLAMMEMKILLAHIIINFDIILDARTPEILEIDPEHLISVPISDIWIRFTPR